MYVFTCVQKKMLEKRSHKVVVGTARLCLEAAGREGMTFTFSLVHFWPFVLLPERDTFVA